MEYRDILNTLLILSHNDVVLTWYLIKEFHAKTSGVMLHGVMPVDWQRQRAHYKGKW